MSKLPLPAVIFAVVFHGSLALAQNAPGPPQPVPVRRISPPGANQAHPQEPKPTLSKNYEINLAVTAHDKAVGEMSVLTCSPSVEVEATIDFIETPTSLSLQGTLTEKEDGSLSFNYVFKFSVPIVTNTQGPSAPGMPANSFRNIQYQQQSVSGQLLMKPDKSYEFFKAAGRSYSLKISTETE